MRAVIAKLEVILLEEDMARVKLLANSALTTLRNGVKNA